MDMTKFFVPFVLLFIVHKLSSLPIVPSRADSLLATQHVNRMIKDASCSKPVPKVVRVQDLLPNSTPHKQYLPHCTVLHFCGQESGCCRSERHHCVPKNVEEVKLYFLTVELTPTGTKKGVETITAKNHTECHCVPINSKIVQSTTEAVISSTTELVPANDPKLS